MWSRGSKPSAAKSRGVPTVLQHHEVVLAARGRLVGREVGDRHQRVVATPSRPLCWAASASLTSAASALVRVEQRCFSSPCACGICLPSCLLLGPEGLEVGDRPGGAPRRPTSGSVDDVGGQPALGLGGAHAVGVVSEQAGIDHGLRLEPGRAGGRAATRCPAAIHRARRAYCAGARSTPRGGARARRRRCLLLFAVLAFAGARGRPRPARHPRRLGRRPRSGRSVADRAGCDDVLPVIEVGLRHPGDDDRDGLLARRPAHTDEHGARRLHGRS